MRASKGRKRGGTTPKKCKGKESLLQDGPDADDAPGEAHGLLDDHNGAGPGLLYASVTCKAPAQLGAVMFPAIELPPPAPAAKTAAAPPAAAADNEVQVLTSAEAAAAEKKRFKFAAPYGNKYDMQLLHQLGPNADEAMANNIAYQDPVLFKSQRPGLAERWGAVAVEFAQKTGASPVPSKDNLSRRVAELIAEAKEWYSKWGHKDKEPTGNCKTTRLVNGKVVEWKWEQWMRTAMDVNKRRTAAEDKVDEVKVNSAKKKEAGAHLSMLRRQLLVTTDPKAKNKLLVAINQAQTEYLTAHVKVEEGGDSSDSEGEDEDDGLRGGGSEGGADLDELGAVAMGTAGKKRKRSTASKSNAVSELVAAGAARAEANTAALNALLADRKEDRAWKREEADRQHQRNMEIARLNAQQQLEQLKVMAEALAGARH